MNIGRQKQKSPDSFGAGTNLSVTLLLAAGFAHRLEALHADLHAAGRAVNEGLDCAQIRCKDSFVYIVCMGNSATRNRMLSTEFTGSGHVIPPKMVVSYFL